MPWNRATDSKLDLASGFKQLTDRCLSLAAEKAAADAENARLKALLDENHRLLDSLNR